MKRSPDAARHNPDPDYLRSLIENSGLSQAKCAALIGVDLRLLKRYLQRDRGDGSAVCRYPVQYCLEALAEKARRKNC